MNFDKISKSLINGFLKIFDFDVSPLAWLSLPNLFPSVNLLTAPGANIAGATRISAAMLSGASKYELTATREPAECLEY